LPIGPNIETVDPALGPTHNGEFTAMKTSLVLLAFALAVLATPAQAQTAKPTPLIFNGMIFDPVPPQSYATPATTAKPARHVRKARVRSAT
jgi:hypothetical protein